MTVWTLKFAPMADVFQNATPTANVHLILNAEEGFVFWLTIVIMTRIVVLVKPVKRI